MSRGQLRVYLGVAPGAGKSHALLDEAHRRVARGNDVVVAAIDPRGRPDLAASLTGLELLGDGRQVDVQAVLARRPSVVMIDDLHETNLPGSAHPYRWQDVEALVAAGLDVVTTIDIRFVASLADVVETVTGVRPRSGVPDRLLREADQLQLVDITPRALRRRLAHGTLHPAEHLDAGLSASFRLPVLAALRELALTWAVGVVAHQHQVDAERARGVGARGVGAGGVGAVVRERVLVAVSGGPESGPLLRRAARLVARMPGAELRVVHVLSGRLAAGGGEPGGPGYGGDAAGLRELAADLDASYLQVIGEDVAAALLAVAEAEQATWLVVGAGPPRRGSGVLRRGAGLLRRQDIVARLLAAGRRVDVHVVDLPAEQHRDDGRPSPTAGLSRWRLATGFGLAVLLPAVLAVGLHAAGAWVGLAGVSLMFLLAVVVTALVGGLGPALLSAVTGSTLLNYEFIPPVHTFRVSEPHNVITLVVFVLVAALVSTVVHRAASLAARAARASAESRSLSAMASGVLRGEEALPTLLEHVRTAFGMTSAALLERATEPDGAAGGRWRTIDAQGASAPTHPDEADVTVPAGHGLVLALSGRTLAATDRAILRAFATQAQGMLERDRLSRAAAQATRLEATERLRNALLAALGHDLRTPLASARAAVNSLQAADVAWSGQERQELLATAEESLARLSTLVADLLDLSRLRAGVLTVSCEQVWLDDLIPPALDELGAPAGQVTIQLAADLPPALADAALLTRALVNVIGNALRYAPAGTAPTVTVSSTGDRVEVRVIDRGTGVPERDRERIFVPFQRLGDTDNETGLGLGLALSRGLVEAMQGTLEAEDTPGGGLTMVLSLPAASGAPPDVVQPGERERKGMIS